MEVPKTRSGHQRIEAIDAARGSAMVFVFLSHFVEVYFRRHDLPLSLAYGVTMIASPAFILISGVMLGILYCRNRDHFQGTKSRFIRRGLFLLTVGRVMIYVAHVPFAGGWQEALRWGFMTDAIGVCIILGPLLIERVDGRGRLLIGMLLLVASWSVVLHWNAGSGLAEAFKEMFFGPYGPTDRFFTDVFPIVPWLGLYFIATSLGGHLGELFATDREQKVVQIVFRIGVIGTLTGACLIALRFILKGMGDEVVRTGLAALLSPFQKTPPSPAYIVFYGGCAFMLLFVLLRYQSLGVVNRYSSIIAVLGRTSLFVFIVQYFVYFSLIAVIDFGPAVLWPFYFAVSAVAIWGAALLWDRGDMNRWLIIPELRSR